MRDLDARIAVAELFGYKWPKTKEEMNAIGWTLGGLYIPKIPEYTSDLNAIKEAINKLIIRGSPIVQYRSNEELFQEQLDMICDREQVPVWHFDARLYCEALLRTFNKWENQHASSNSS